MKALITGAAGFVGSYLAEYLQKDCGWDVSVTKLEQENFQMEGISVFDLNILDAEEVQRLLVRLEPDYLFHLAAQSSVALSWNKPELTLDVNLKGCVHVLEAARRLKKMPRILLIGSSEEYGLVRGRAAIDENEPLHPRNLYAATKACQNMIGNIYVDAYRMEIVMVRAFNHIGPKQAPIFVVSDFCKQVAEIEAEKQEPVMWVGNLSAKRDFTDVRDIVRAYVLLIQRGTVGETYNVGSGVAVSIQEILEKILCMSSKKITVKTDPAKLRPTDVPVIQADIKKLKEATGWERRIPLEETLKEILNDWRLQVR